MFLTVWDCTYNLLLLTFVRRLFITDYFMYYELLDIVGEGDMFLLLH